MATYQNREQNTHAHALLCTRVATVDRDAWLTEDFHDDGENQIDVDLFNGAFTRRKVSRMMLYVETLSVHDSYILSERNGPPSTPQSVVLLHWSVCFLRSLYEGGRRIVARWR